MAAAVALLGPYRTPPTQLPRQPVGLGNNDHGQL